MTTTTLITGANRGLGLEFVRQLSAEPHNHRVIATARDPESATELKALLSDDDLLLPLDVTSQASADALAASLDKAGVRAIDLLINNAGVGGKGAPLAETDPENILHVLDVNAVGPMRTTKALLPLVGRGSWNGGAGLIINVSSQLGSIHSNTGGSSYAYRSSKAALNMLNKHLAIELADAGVTPVAIHPGWVQTDMGGPDAHLTPEQSIRSIIDHIITRATRATHAGTFRNFDGTELPW